MPSLRVHAYIDGLYFGKKYWKIHRDMDEPVFFLGRGHRILYHNFESAYIIASDRYPDDENAILAAQYHIILDEQCSQDPEFKKSLEIIAKLESTNKKRKRKKTSNKTDPDLKWLRKLAKAMKLTRALLHA